MNDPNKTFGRIFRDAPSIEALITLEQRENKSDRFAKLDSLLTDLIKRAFRGERIVRMVENEVYENSVTINGLSSDDRAFLSSSFGLSQQQSKGAWFLPEKVSLPGGAANFPFYLTTNCRFPHTLSSLERGRVLPKSSADAVFLWAVLAPFFEELLAPFELRGRLTGTQEEDLDAWREVELFYGSLGLFRALEKSPLFETRNTVADAATLLRNKQLLLTSLSAATDKNVGTRYRLCSLMPLIEQYYKKAKPDGRVKRKQVLTKPFQPTLSAFFEGNWLSFLDYIDEEPHPDEQIVTALPKTPLRVRGASRAEEIAQKQGIPAEEVKRIAAALWNESLGASPVESRVATLETFWNVFDEIHARQESGMKPLWGLIEETGFIGFGRNDQSPYQPRLYRELIPAQLNNEIETHWGSGMLPRWPDRIVTEPFPHQLMTETFGPALLFWQSCALTTWFICEGPFSRTDLAGLEHHERRELHALREMQTPIDEQLFKELIKAESRLGPEESITTDSTTTDVGHGFSITMSVSAGSRRKGFEILRDIVTRHRRSWAVKYLERYLRLRWETEIGEAAKAFNLLLSEKGGKGPTVKQFAKSATLATNHWFKGDISGLYRTIGEKTPVEPTRCVILPVDKEAFIRSVLHGLPSLQFQIYEGRMSDETVQNSYREYLAELAIKYVQLEEAIGQAPEMKSLGDKFTYRSKVLSPDESEAWRIFSRAVESALVSVGKNEPTTALSTKPENSAPPASRTLAENVEEPQKKRSWISRMFGDD